MKMARFVFIVKRWKTNIYLLLKRSQQLSSGDQFFTIQLSSGDQFFTMMSFRIILQFYQRKTQCKNALSQIVKKETAQISLTSDWSKILWRQWPCLPEIFPLILKYLRLPKSTSSAKKVLAVPGSLEINFSIIETYVILYYILVLRNILIQYKNKLFASKSTDVRFWITPSPYPPLSANAHIRCWDK